MKTLMLCLATCIAFACNPARAASTINFAPLAKLVDDTKQVTGQRSGTAIAVIKNGKVIYQGYFGYADIEKKIPITAETAFYIASSTKPLFALNILLQETSGNLDTGNSLQSMFPTTKFEGFDAGAITAHDLLVHASGIDNEPLVWATAFSGIHDQNSLARLVAASYPNTGIAHGQFSYSNVGYNITSLWATRVLGTPWQEQLRHSVFEPLEMHHSSAYMSEAKAAGWQVAEPYTIASQAPNEPIYLRKTDETMHAAGGVIAAAPDLARLMIAELDGGKVDGKQLLPSKVIARSQEDQIKLDEQYLDFHRTGYAWGWYSGIYKQQRMLHHFGGFAGYHAHLSFMPDAGIALVVLNNEDMLAGRLTSLIADYVYGSLLEDQETLKRVTERFAELNTGIAQMQSGLGKRQAALDARPWALTLPKAAYAGTYNHELLGDFNVSVDNDGRMQLTWGRVNAIATGMEQSDQVRVEFVPNSGKVVGFVVENERVTGITFNGMRFERKR